MARAARCLCGEPLAPTLAQLGSLWCHECRYDDERRYQVVARMKRERAEPPKSRRVTA